MSDKPRILVVDDQADNRMLLQVFLRATGIEIDQAGNGIEALERLARHRYDLVLMDVHMPELDGLSATRRLREQEREAGDRHTVVLALTGDDTDEDRQRSRDAGCDGHLVKPIRRKQLIAAIGEWLSVG